MNLELHSTASELTQYPALRHVDLARKPNSHTVVNHENSSVAKTTVSVLKVNLAYTMPKFLAPEWFINMLLSNQLTTYKLSYANKYATLTLTLG